MTRWPWSCLWEQRRSATVTEMFTSPTILTILTSKTNLVSPTNTHKLARQISLTPHKQLNQLDHPSNITPTSIIHSPPSLLPFIVKTTAAMIRHCSFIKTVPDSPLSPAIPVTAYYSMNGFLKEEPILSSPLLQSHCQALTLPFCMGGVSCILLCILWYSVSWCG